MHPTIRWTIVSFLLVRGLPALAQQPTVTDDRLLIELVAREPAIVTPTGLAVDEQGRVWVIENNTHQRQPDYKGFPSDRIQVFSDFDSSGKARQITTFADGFKNAMGLALGRDGAVYLATRSEIFLLRGKDGKAVEKRSLLKLETPGDYPHNGLCGFAFDGMGDMYFGMGENLGAPYKLIGSDGTTLSGGGEGGNMFRCRPDGSKLIRVATGFWNPFHHCVDAFGRLFAVDNDPDSRGPCRLVHVVQGGDYGYRFRYGRKGTHPFQAWSGDLPGTLGMVAGTGEAPSGIIAYESTGLPAEYRGNLIVTSWGDHIIERFQLQPNGASFRAKSQTLVRGGENFRPVGIAVGPDGVIYVSDWVDKSYPVHGKGRIWRIRMKQPPADDGLRPSQVAGLGDARLAKLLGHPKIEIRAAATEAVAKNGRPSKDILAGVFRSKTETRAKLHALWANSLGKRDADLFLAALDDTEPEVRAEAVRLLPSGNDWDEFLSMERLTKDSSPNVRMHALLRLGPSSFFRKKIIPWLADKDPFLVSAAIHALGRSGNSGLLLPSIKESNPRLRLGLLLALRITGDPEGRTALGNFLKDADPEVRRTAIQWVGEERLKEFAPLLPAAAAQAPVTPALFRSLLAANHLLAGGKPDAEPFEENVIAKVVMDAGQPSVFRVLSLQMLRPDHPAVSAANLNKLLTSKDAALRRQTLRTLALRTDKASQELLLSQAKDSTLEPALRADAVMGLAHSAASSAEAQRLLISLLEIPELRRDALRSLRSAAAVPHVQQALLSLWIKKDGSKEERREIAWQLVLALKSHQNPDVDAHWRDIIELAGPLPKTTAAWQKVLTGRGDPAAGERVFFHAHGPRCATCHRIDGRGAMIGPELSTIGAALNRERLIESILEPSKEIAPMFVNWSITTRDGKVRTGVIVEEGPNSTVTVADAQGKLEVLQRHDIEERMALPTSLMPNNLHELMTPREFLDLITYLEERTGK